VTVVLAPIVAIPGAVYIGSIRFRAKKWFSLRYC